MPNLAFSKVCTAVFAVPGIRIMSFRTANPARLGGNRLFADLGQLCRNDACGHRNNPITHDHDQRRQNLSNGCLRRQVTVAHSGQCDD